MRALTGLKLTVEGSKADSTGPSAFLLHVSFGSASGVQASEAQEIVEAIKTRKQQALDQRSKVTAKDVAAMSLGVDDDDTDGDDDNHMDKIRWPQRDVGFSYMCFFFLLSCMWVMLYGGDSSSLLINGEARI